MADEYKLKIVIDDSQIKDLESRLGKLMGSKPAGASGGSKDEGKGGLLSGLMGGGDSKSMFKNIAKLGGIAVGITAVVGLVKKLTSMVVDSSPMLQQMLKLFNFGVMMLLRPIGDFIGFALRPIMMMMLTRFIIPFYRNVLPFMQQAGDWIGNKIVPWIEALFNAVIGVGEFIVGKLTFNGEMADRGWARILDSFGIANTKTDKGTHETINVGNKVSNIGNQITNKLELLKNNIGGKVAEAMNNLKSSQSSAATGKIRNMMESFGNITAGSGRFGFARLGEQHLGGVDQNSLRLMGAGQANIQARISNGDFRTVTEALKAYVEYIKTSGRSTGLTNPEALKQQMMQLTIEGNVYGMDDLEDKIEEVIQRVGARGTIING